MGVRFVSVVASPMEMSVIFCRYRVLYCNFLIGVIYGKIGNFNMITGESEGRCKICKSFRWSSSRYAISKDYRENVKSGLLERKELTSP